MKELQGKIVIFVQSAAMAKAGYNDIPVNRHYDKSGSGYNHLFQFSGSNEAAKAIRQDKWNASDISTKVSAIKSSFQTFWKAIDEYNTGNIYSLNQFNAWKWSTGGSAFAGSYSYKKIEWKTKKVWFVKVKYPVLTTVTVQGVNQQILTM